MLMDLRFCLFCGLSPAPQQLKLTSKANMGRWLFCDSLIGPSLEWSTLWIRTSKYIYIQYYFRQTSSISKKAPHTHAHDIYHESHSCTTDGRSRHGKWKGEIIAHSPRILCLMENGDSIERTLYVLNNLPAAFICPVFIGLRFVFFRINKSVRPVPSFPTH